MSCRRSSRDAEARPAGDHRRLRGRHRGRGGGGRGSGSRAAPGKARGKTPNLDQFTVNLTANARAGQDRPGAGARFRDPPGDRHPDAAPAEQSRFSPARPAWARPPWWKDSRCASRRATCLRRSKNVDGAHARSGAAASRRGDQGRIREPLEGLDRGGEGSPTPIILFIDEAHTMIGAGGQAGQNDAANLLKPALARGELRTIAATTWTRIQEILRKGSGAGAAFPGGQSGGAGRSHLHGDDARHRRRARKAPQRADSGRRRGRGGASFASLPGGPAVAG